MSAAGVGSAVIEHLGVSQMPSTIEEWCEVVEKESQVAWITLQNRGGKTKDACADFEKVLKDKKPDDKKKQKSRKALQDAVDSAQEGIDSADETIKKGDDIIDILTKKHGKDVVAEKCKKAIEELDTAKDYRKDIKPIMEKSQKLLKQNP
jgi:hypothetical protein